MKIILITDAESNWCVEYIDRVFKNEKVDLCIVSLHGEKNKKYYAEQNIPVYTYYSDSRYFVVRWLYRKKLAHRIKREFGSCDAIHVNLATAPAMDRLAELWDLAPKHIVTFWGSDLLRASDKVLLKFNRLLQKVDSINLLTENMRTRFNDVFGDAFSDKLTVFDFGCPMYESIDKVKQTLDKGRCKEYLGIDSEKIVVPIGYNSIIEQQHLKIIEAIKDIDSKLKDQIVFVLHFCYGLDNQEDYFLAIKEKLEVYHMNYKIIDRFLDKRETSILRCASDIFLYAQTTDALSASVIEYLYSGCLLVKPDWLSYPELDSRSVKYISYRDFERLKDAFLGAIDIYDDENRLKEYQNNRDILWNMNSWEVVAPKWRALYED